MPYNFPGAPELHLFCSLWVLTQSVCQYSSLSARLYNMYCTTKVTRRHNKLQENKAAYKESTKVICKFYVAIKRVGRLSIFRV